MILVLGGAGYIGSHTVKRLLTEGMDVVVYDDLRHGHREAINGVPLVVGDINDVDQLRQTLRQYKVDAVIHFAALCYVGESVEQPLHYYNNNVVGTLRALESMLAEETKYIIFSSSAAVYGVPAKIPITEDVPRHPINPYGSTKSMMEQILRDFDRAYGIRFTALRYFNAAGADLEGQLGEWHDPESHLIPLAVEAALGRRDSFTIFGDDYDTPDGTCVRDFIHVDDLAQAHVKALKRLQNGAESASFNLGNGSGFSVREVLDVVREVSGRDFAVKVGPQRAGDPPTLVADATLAIKELGWSQKCSDLQTIVQTAYSWLERHPKGYAS